MITYIFPVVLIIVSNIVYQICAKSVPASVNPLASLTVTYTVGAVASAVLYFLLNKNADLLREYQHLNWAPFVLGVVIVGLEAGFLYAYKAGWPVSTVTVVQSAFVAVALLVIGYFFYREQITWNKVVGILICLVGLGFINI
jgi:drug/metabolite transporter (DMT)-like permease